MEYEYGGRGGHHLKSPGASPSIGVQNTSEFARNTSGSGSSRERHRIPGIINIPQGILGILNSDFLRFLAFLTKHYLFCFKRVVQIAPRGHFFTFGSQKLCFQALPGLAKTLKIFFAETQSSENTINVTVF